MQPKLQPYNPREGHWHDAIPEARPTHTLSKKDKKLLAGMLGEMFVDGIRFDIAMLGIPRFKMHMNPFRKGGPAFTHFDPIGQQLVIRGGVDDDTLEHMEMVVRQYLLNKYQGTERAKIPVDVLVYDERHSR